MNLLRNKDRFGGKPQTGEEDRLDLEKLAGEQAEQKRKKQAADAEAARQQEEEKRRQLEEEEESRSSSTALVQCLKPARTKVQSSSASTITIHNSPLFQARYQEMFGYNGKAGVVETERLLELDRKAQAAVSQDFKSVAKKVLEAEFIAGWDRFDPEYQKHATVLYEGILPTDVLSKMKEQFGFGDGNQQLIPEALRRVVRAYTYLQTKRRVKEDGSDVVPFEVVPEIVLLMYFIAQKEILFQAQAATHGERRADKEYQQALQLYDRYLSPRQERSYTAKKRDILPEREKERQFFAGSLKSIVQVLDGNTNNVDDFNAGYRDVETRTELCCYLVDPMPDLGIKIVTKDDHRRDDALESQRRVKMLEQMTPEGREDYIEQRNEKIREIYAGIVEVNELFVRMAEIVHGQWDTNNSIHAKADTALTLTREGYWEIVAASQAQNGHLFQSFMTSLYKGRTFWDRNIDKTCEAIWDNGELSLIQKIRQIMVQYRDSFGSRNHRAKAIEIITQLDNLHEKSKSEQEENYVKRVSEAVTPLLEQYIGAIAKDGYSSFRMRCKFVRNHLDFARQAADLITEKERTKRWQPPH